MSTQYQALLLEVRDAYAKTTETALSLRSAQEACAQANTRVVSAMNNLTKYVESLEVQIEAPPS